MFYKLFKFSTLLLILSALTQCSYNALLQDTPNVVTEDQRPAAWKKNQVSLNQLRTKKNWTMLARVGLVSKQGSSSSQLDWINNSNSNYQITLNNMLTYGVIVIHKKQNQVTLKYQDELYTAKNPEELLHKLTSLKLPVSQLEYWLLGLPSPHLKTHDLELNKYALLQSLTQDSFKITYDSYSHVGDYKLPHKIIIKSPAVHIKINVQGWNLNSE